MIRPAKGKRLLLTGASGFLGWNICRHVPKEWEIYGLVFSHSITLPGMTFIQTDLRNFKDLENLFKTINPKAVIHTAAITDPNYCQLHRKETQTVNLEASLQIADLCADHQIPLVFTSSDLVFDGLHPPYSEADPPCPVNVYGEQKAMAEAGMRQRWRETIVCRLPLLFGEPGLVAQSFLQPMLKAIRADRELCLFVDEFRTPVSGKVATEGLFLALKKAKGIIHLGGRESISRYNFGLLMKNITGIEKGKIIPCTRKDLKMPAPRPPDVSLNSSKAFSLGFNPPALIEDLKDNGF